MAHKRKGGPENLVYGVGINDTDYQLFKAESYIDENGKRRKRVLFYCVYYRTWREMLRRGYCEKFKKKCPTYTDCTVVTEWHLFSNFKRWMEQQDWQGKELDKDILFEDNKQYGPDKCVFVSRRVNTFLINQVGVKTNTSSYIGVHWETKSAKYKTQCNSVTTGKQIHLGYFLDPLEAHNAWREFKLEQALILIEQENLSDQIADALINRYQQKLSGIGVVNDENL